MHWCRCTDPRFPQKPKFGTTASLVHSVQYIFLSWEQQSVMPAAWATQPWTKTAAT